MLGQRRSDGVNARAGVEGKVDSNRERWNKERVGGSWEEKEAMVGGRGQRQL